jgi:hypothetical protein
VCGRPYMPYRLLSHLSFRGFTPSWLPALPLYSWFWL